MKRTRETIFYSHPDSKEEGCRKGISGCRFHDGEDNGYGARVAADRKACMAAWNQQMEEKKQAKQI